VEFSVGAREIDAIQCMSVWIYRRQCMQGAYTLYVLLYTRVSENTGFINDCIVNIEWNIFRP